MSPRGLEQNEKMRADALAKISRAALDAFTEYGYQGATMKRIAEAASLSYGLAYHYFPTKEGVFLHLLDFALQSSMLTLDAALNAPLTAWGKIERLSEILAQNAFSSASSLYFLLIIQAMTQGRTIPAYYEKLRPVIAQAQESGEATAGDPYMLAVAFFSLVQGFALLSFQGKGIERSITPDILSNLLLERGMSQ
jgi:AcrR family transcriptional regulator